MYSIGHAHWLDSTTLPLASGRCNGINISIGGVICAGMNDFLINYLSEWWLVLCHPWCTCISYVVTCKNVSHANGPMNTTWIRERWVWQEQVQGVIYYRWWTCWDVLLQGQLRTYFRRAALNKTIRSSNHTWHCCHCCQLRTQTLCVCVYVCVWKLMRA